MACTSEVGDGAVDQSEDEIVATFEQGGKIDLAKTSHLLLVGDSESLGQLPLWAATTKARRIAELYPDEQVVLFLTKDIRDQSVAKLGASTVQEVNSGNVTLGDFRRLDASKLVAALDRFTRIASIEFFGHSSPFGALTETSGEDRNLNPENLGVLADNFARDRNPFVALNGCNGGATLAPALSKVLRVPVSGAMTGSNFQVLMSDGRWYPNDPGYYPAGLQAVPTNDKSLRVPTSCSKGACVRMKPQDSPYRGIWALPSTGFQYGLGFYKFFCAWDEADRDGSCARGMAESLYTFPSTRLIDRRSSDADFREVVADFLCNTNKENEWYDSCRANLFDAVANDKPLSTMRYATEYSHECSFSGCSQKLRCKEIDGVWQYKSCVWVDGSCRDDQKPAACRPKNEAPHTATNEFDRYLKGHQLVRGH